MQIHTNMLAITSLILTTTIHGEVLDPPTETVNYCMPKSETDLRLEGFQLELPIQTAAGINRFGAPNVETILSNGPSANRVDIVFIGDGFTKADLPTWPAVAVAGYERLFQYEPFIRYQEYFNVHRVDVISAESGVDDDPTEGVERDTALDMRFWCSGIERLLCVNTGSAAAMASFAPDVDQIAAVANSTKYGGAGYSGADIGTYSAFNASSVEVFIHELGHSLGNLADEYTYGGSSDTYTGGESAAANASILGFDAMSGSGQKWDRWLGSNLAGVGAHDCFEGCAYHSFGIYRPSGNSMMRSLAQPFNSPSREELIFQFYGLAGVVDTFEPSGGETVSDALLVVNTVLSDSTATTKRWWIDEVEIENDQNTLDLSAYEVVPGSRILVEVVDNTDMVRNESMRDALMTEIHEWIVVGSSCSANEVVDCDGSEACWPATWVGDGYCDGVAQVYEADLCCLELDGGDCNLLQCGLLPADINGDGAVNGADLAALLGGWGSNDPELDLDQNGSVGGGDLAIVLGAWT
tara:strand:+ start:185 stop:1756 length:1572 start_codon:yes stop_codon:yes gene_type:complete